MEFIPTKCPSCGGDLMIPKAKDDAICTYCGSKFLLKDAASKSPTPSIENWLKLANTALSSGNAKESYDYFNRILEVDAENIEAWLGKGESAGWLSTLGNQKITEMILTFLEAIEYSDKNSQDEVKLKIASSATEVLKSFYKLATDSFTEHMKLDNTWDEFVSYSKVTIEGIDFVIGLNPGHPINGIVATLGIWATGNLINGIHYKDYNDISQKKGISESEKQLLLNKRQGYIDIVLVIDPAFDVPQLNKKPDCFIATATMGDYDHPYVVSLRLFRDKILLANWAGTKFVAFYYRTSPYFATIIEKSGILRKISLWLLIEPSAKLANRINKSLEN